ncbi:MAG: hypothetical protein ACFFB6_13305 [Promethearchaeota archaeon]
MIKKGKKRKRKLIFKESTPISEGTEKPDKVFEPILGKTDRYQWSFPSPYHFMSKININPKRHKKKET